MKNMNRLYLAIGIGLMISGFMGAFVLAIHDSLAGIILSIVAIAIGAISFNHWSAISYKWTCQACNNEKVLNDRENFVYQNVGVLQKSFKCEQCDHKTTFIGEIKLDI